ncbi:hypothetical protein [Ketogulonicigenium vulgare]|uniref:hypothetical protein n=1 Tax=Ketogulonicigenium vulgare TaxID=92945 RepID=UPI002358635A|nr:hypothetical protein [Ketogulonicigenium vulgare]
MQTPSPHFPTESVPDFTGQRTNGYAAIISGTLDPNTLSGSPITTAKLALIQHRGISVKCPDNFCNCALNDLASNFPDAIVVPVEVVAHV